MTRASRCLPGWRRLARRLFIHVSLYLGRSEAAMTGLQDLLEEAPGRVRDALVLSNLLFEAGRGAEAVLWLERTLAAAPDAADAWFNLGFLRHAAGQVRPAEQAFERAVALAPHHDRAWFGLGQVRAVRGAHAEAIQALARAAELQPFAPDPHQALVDACLACGRVDEAWRWQGRLAAHDPRPAAALAQRIESWKPPSREALCP